MTAAPDSASPRRQRKRTHGGLLLLGTLVVTLGLLASLEAVLRFTGLGDLPLAQSSRLAYQQAYPPMLSVGARPDGTPALLTNDARVPWQALDTPKRAGALRIVALGGSATAGLGFSPNVSFPRELERLLSAACPERTIEVLNLGIVALSSAQVRWMLDDACRQLDPDALLVYSGNNEFLELHSQKFADAQGLSGGSSLSAWLNKTNLFRLMGGLARNAARGRNVTIFDMAEAQARVSETEIMKQVSLSPEEVAGVVDGYEQNLRAMVASAESTDTPLLLMTVASNWQWQGRHDLPEDWMVDLVDRSRVDAGAHPAAMIAPCLKAVEENLAAAPVAQRHEWLFKRGLLLGYLQRWDEARASLRAAMNEDPRQRRASDALAERVRAVAADTGTPLLDVIERLSSGAEHGIVGDEQFYDYVHFTPEGCVLVAGMAAQSLAAEGVLQFAPGFSLEGWMAARVAALAGLTEDPLAVGDWLGIGDLSLVHDRDLWKHQVHVRDLDARLAANPDDVDALVRRGNAWFFARDGFDEAQRCYRRALELQPDLAVAADNLARLRGRRQP